MSNEYMSYYTLTDIMNILKISKQTAYDFVKKTALEQKPFRVFKILSQYRIPSKSFDSWFYGSSENHEKTALKDGVYDIKEIMPILNLSKQTSYNFIKKVYREQKPFRVLKILSIYRIPKSAFHIWLKEISNDTL